MGTFLFVIDYYPLWSQVHVDWGEISLTFQPNCSMYSHFDGSPQCSLPRPESATKLHLALPDI